MTHKYSPYLSLILLVLVVGGIYAFGHTKDGAIQKSDSGISQTIGTTTPPISEQYQQSQFKVVAIVPDQFSPTYENLYIVGGRGGNDEACGGMYTETPCYFFLEANYYGVPPITYVGTWSGVPVGQASAKAHFIDKDTVIFSGDEGDGGGSVYQTWKLDVRTGSTTLLKDIHSGT